MARSDSGQGFVEIDERWFSDWFEQGYQDLCAFLAKQAAFDAWCSAHPRKPRR